MGKKISSIKIGGNEYKIANIIDNCLDNFEYCEDEKVYCGYIDNMYTELRASCSRYIVDITFFDSSQTDMKIILSNKEVISALYLLQTVALTSEKSIGYYDYDIDNAVLRWSLTGRPILWLGLRIDKVEVWN